MKKQLFWGMLVFLFAVSTLSMVSATVTSDHVAETLPPGPYGIIVLK